MENKPICPINGEHKVVRNTINNKEYWHCKQCCEDVEYLIENQDEEVNESSIVRNMIPEKFEGLTSEDVNKGYYFTSPEAIADFFLKGKIYIDNEGYVLDQLDVIEKHYEEHKKAYKGE